MERSIPSSALVTGCAGFLGSHLCEALLARGHTVTGVDSFSAYYSRSQKEANLSRVLDADRFRLVEADLAVDPLGPLIDGAKLVFHLAAQPGVRSSFGAGLSTYLHNNVMATRRLLEAASGRDLECFVYASSSSVYGDQDIQPVPEGAPLCPLSPYGATKVITEQLASAFWRARGLPVVGMRYFTVYGPRQRPDMAFSRFFEAALDGCPLTVLGDGRQVREFTYVEDCIRATIAAARQGERGSVYNVGGGQPVSVLRAISLLEELLDTSLEVEHREPGAGDPRQTHADTRRAERDLGYRPGTPLVDGMAAQLEAMRQARLIGIYA